MKNLKRCLALIGVIVISGFSSVPIFAADNFTNLIPANIAAMNTDSDHNGIVDGFAYYNPTGVTVVRSLDGCQKVTVTANTSGNGAVTMLSLNYLVPVTPGDSISCSGDMKILGDVCTRVKIDAYNSSKVYLYGAFNGSVVSSTDFSTSFFENYKVPSGVSYVCLGFLVTPNTANSLGSAWFKNAVLVKSTTLNSVNQISKNIASLKTDVVNSLGSAAPIAAGTGGVVFVLSKVIVFFRRSAI